MAIWTVTSGERAVEVDAANWLGALGRALPELGLSQGALGRLVCSMSDDGGAEAYDPVSGIRISVRAGAGFASEQADVFGDAWRYDGAPAAPAAQATPRPPPAPTDRMEALFDACAEISAAPDIRTACAKAMEVSVTLVPADAGAVLIRTRGGEHLRFAAAHGPTAKRVVDLTMPVDQGIAGFAHNFNMSVIVDDARRDVRHYARVDRATGYATRAVLAVPIRASDGASMGCLELLNPPQPFTVDDLEVVTSVGAALGAWLQNATV